MQVLKHHKSHVFPRKSSLKARAGPEAGRPGRPPQAPAPGPEPPAPFQIFFLLCTWLKKSFFFSPLLAPITVPHFSPQSPRPASRPNHRTLSSNLFILFFYFFQEPFLALCLSHPYLRSPKASLVLYLSHLSAGSLISLQDQESCGLRVLQSLEKIKVLNFLSKFKNIPGLGL